MAHRSGSTLGGSMRHGQPRCHPTLACRLPRKTTMLAHRAHSKRYLQYRTGGKKMLSRGLSASLL